MTVTRGTTNRNDRGNTADRAARRAYLLATFGDGATAPCWRCEVVLTDETITVDRIVPGAEGGTYRRDNIRPACAPCNSLTGATLGVARKRGSTGNRARGRVTDAEIIELARSGATNVQIAAKLGVTPQTLFRWRAKNDSLNNAIMTLRAQRQRPEPEHGTRARRATGCPCEPCKIAARQHQAEMYQRRKARRAAGIEREASSQQSIIESAYARGLTTSEVMAELGLPYHTVAVARAASDRAVAS